MTYNPNIPQDTPPPNIAVTSLQTNFSQYGTNFALNHTALNNTNQGKHEAVVFEGQAGDPGVTDDYVAIYGKSVTSAAGTAQELFLQIPQFLPNEQPNLPQQLTYNTVNTTGPQYQTFLPGGYVMSFGQVNSVPTTITLSPTVSGIASVVVNANNLSGSSIPFDVHAELVTTTSFIIKSSNASGSFTFTWVAIGTQ